MVDQINNSNIKTQAQAATKRAGAEGGATDAHAADFKLAQLRTATDVQQRRGIEQQTSDRNSFLSRLQQNTQADRASQRQIGPDASDESIREEASEDAAEREKADERRAPQQQRNRAAAKRKGAGSQGAGGADEEDLAVDREEEHTDSGRARKVARRDGDQGSGQGQGGNHGQDADEHHTRLIKASAVGRAAGPQDDFLQAGRADGVQRGEGAGRTDAASLDDFAAGVNGKLVPASASRITQRPASADDLIDFKLRKPSVFPQFRHYSSRIRSTGQQILATQPVSQLTGIGHTRLRPQRVLSPELLAAKKRQQAMTKGVAAPDAPAVKKLNQKKRAMALGELLKIPASQRDGELTGTQKNQAYAGQAYIQENQKFANLPMIDKRQKRDHADMADRPALLSPGMVADHKQIALHGADGLVVKADAGRPAGLVTARMLAEMKQMETAGLRHEGRAAAAA